MTLTLAEKFTDISWEESRAIRRHNKNEADRLKAKRLAFEEQYCVTAGYAKIGTWESRTWVFVDASVCIHSACLCSDAYDTFY